VSSPSARSAAAGNHPVPWCRGCRRLNPPLFTFPFTPSSPSRSISSYSPSAQTQQLNSNTKIVIESIIIIVTSHPTPFFSPLLNQSINPPPIIQIIQNVAKKVKHHPPSFEEEGNKRARGGGGKKLKFVSACARRPPPGPSEQEDRITRVYTINPAKTTLSPPTTAATKPGVRPRSRGSLSICGKRIDAAEEVILFSSRSPCDDDDDEDEEGEARTPEDVRSARSATDKRAKVKVLRKR